MSVAQIELMCADCSITVYPKTDSVKDGKGKEHQFSRPSTRSLNEAREKFEKMSENQNLTVDFSKFNFT